MQTKTKENTDIDQLLTENGLDSDYARFKFDLHKLYLESRYKFRGEDDPDLIHMAILRTKMDVQNK